MAERTDELVSEIPVGTEGIPNLQRGLGQLENAVASLRRNVMDDDFGGRGEANMFTKSDEGMGMGEDGDRAGKKDFLVSRGQRLLGQYNFDAEKLERGLHQIVPRANAQGPEEEVYDHHIQVFASSIHEALVTTMSTSEHKNLCLMEDEWEEEKSRIMEDLRRPSGPARSGTTTIASRPEFKDVVGSTAFSNSSSSALSSSQNLAAPEYAYSGSDRDMVYQYLTQLRSTSKESGALAAQFGKLAREPWSQSTWSLVSSILEHSSANNQEGWLKGSLVFLEKQYYKHKVLASDRSASSLSGSAKDHIVRWLDSVRKQPLLGSGGLATALNQYSVGSGSASGASSNSVSGLFDSIGNGSNGNNFGAGMEYQYGGLPFWAVVYYCLRVGSWEDAAAVASEAMSKLDDLENAMCEGLLALSKNSDTVGEKLKKLAKMMDGDEDSNNGGASRSGAMVPFGGMSRAQSSLETNRWGDAARLQQSSSWKRAVLYILLAGKPNDRLLERVVNATVQDFMWLKLSVLRVLQASKNITGQERALANLQSTLQRNGPAHFAGGNDHQLYARLMMMAQKPLLAIEYLENLAPPNSGLNGSSFGDAVHIALALQQEGLLAGPPLPNEQSVDSSIEAEADKKLGELVLQYTKPRFARDEPGSAMLYFARAFRPRSAASRAVIEEGIAHIFYMHADRLDDIRKLSSPELEPVIRPALVRAGRMAENQGKLAEAVRLYMESGQAQEHALTIFNRQLVQAIRPPHVNREELLMQAERLQRDRIDQSLASDHSRAIKTFNLLVGFLRFTHDIEIHRWDSALQRVSGVLPSDPAEVERCKREYFALDELVLDVFSQIFSSALQALQRLSETETEPGRSMQVRKQFQAYQSFSNAIPESTPQIASLIATFQLH